MARITRSSPSVAAPVKQAVLIDPNAFKFTGAGDGLKEIGNVLTELGKRKRDMQDRISISNANAFMENAEREAAKELVDAPFDKRQEIRLKWINIAKEQIGNENLSGEAREIANNKSGIWGDTISDLGEINDITEISTIADFSTSNDFQNALVSFEEGSPEFIEAEDAFDKQYANRPPQEAKVIKDSIVGQTLIFKATNIAADDPTPENIKAARDIIDKHSFDEKDRFVNLQRLRSESAKRTQNRNETFKANLNNQSQKIGQTFAKGEVFEGEVIPELEVAKSQLINRQINDSLNISDMETYNSMLNKINTGEFFEQDEITSAYATGMSSEEYKNIIKLNEQNAKMTSKQREDLGTFGVEIDARYNSMLSSVRPLLSASSGAQVFTAIHKDKTTMKNEVRKMVREGKNPQEIYKVIEANFLRDSDKFHKGFIGTVFSGGGFNIPEDTRSIGQREERFETVMDLLKAGEKKDLKQLGRILKLWYE